MDGGTKVIAPIKKAAVKAAFLIKQIKNLNFKAKEEILEAEELDRQSAWIDLKNRRRRFDYYFKVFGLDEGCPFDDLTEKQAEQYSLIWKLVDLEGGHYE